jgi:tetratricopeptide (TPR) repeat protein
VKALAGLITAGLGLAAAMALSVPAHSQEKQLAQANAALQAGEADKALALLEPLAQPGGEAEAYNLKCRVEYSLEEWDRAANDCEQAVKLDGQSSDDHMWLARALGQKANKATFLSAFSLAKRARAEFEEAVRLNPRNTRALTDLGEFYFSAPEVVGGGMSKSERVAAELDKIDPARAHVLRGRIAEQRKDYGTAEREYRQAIAVSPHPASQWIALASFYRGRERWTEMESAVRSGESAAQRDRHEGVPLYNGAAILRETGRDTARAVRMLESYLAGSAKTEEGPAFVAHVWLAQLKEKLGDSAAASRERATALALARDYKPAQYLKY